jgi:hypothetical protein
MICRFSNIQPGTFMKSTDNIKTDIYNCDFKAVPHLSPAGIYASQFRFNCYNPTILIYQVILWSQRFVPK